MFLQKLWAINQSWDEPLCSELISELISEWNQVLQLLIEIPSLKIPRFVKSTKSNNQLLIFCDASAKAYATVVYLRIKDTNFTTSFLFSKVRLTPIGKRKRSKHLTIPRLELLAVLLGVRVSKFVVKELGLEVTERFLFPDSRCVLYWLKQVNHCLSSLRIV